MSEHVDALGLPEAKGPATARVKHLRSQRKARMAKVAEMVRDGYTFKEIARELGCAVSTVARYTKTLRTLWDQQIPRDVATARRLMEDRLRELDRTAAEEYERSKLPIETSEMEREPVPGKPPDDWPITKVKTRRQGRIGDHAHLETRRRIVKDLRDMHGLDVRPEDERAIQDGAPVNLLQLIFEAEQNLPTVIDSSGVRMVRDANGIPRLPGEVQGNGQSEPQGNGQGEP